MDAKTIWATIIGAAVTLLVTTVVASLLGVFAAGSDALSKDQIKEVMNEVLVTPAGVSFGAEIAAINTRLTAIETTLLHQQRALEALSAD